MGTPTLSVLGSAKSCDHGERSLDEHREDFVEAPASRNRAARGVVTGILVGAGLWGAILVLIGFIKL